MAKVMAPIKFNLHLEYSDMFTENAKQALPVWEQLSDSASRNLDGSHRGTRTMTCWCVAGLSSRLSGQGVQSIKADGLPGLPLEETEPPDGLMWTVTGLLCGCSNYLGHSGDWCRWSEDWLDSHNWSLWYEAQSDLRGGANYVLFKHGGVSWAGLVQKLELDEKLIVREPQRTDSRISRSMPSNHRTRGSSSSGAPACPSPLPSQELIGAEGRELGIESFRSTVCWPFTILYSPYSVRFWGDHTSGFPVHPPESQLLATPCSHHLGLPDVCCSMSAHKCGSRQTYVHI